MQGGESHGSGEHVAGVFMDEPDDDMSDLHSVDKRILASVILGVDLTEVFSPVRVNQVAAKFGLNPGSSLDLTNGWNFDLEADRRRAWKLIKHTTVCDYRFTAMHYVQQSPGAESARAQE